MLDQFAAGRLALSVLVAAALLGGVPAGPAAAQQVPETFENLQILPKDISRDSLQAVMDRFRYALGVRCTHCHVSEGGGAGGGGFRFDYKSDAKVQKQTARVMMRMADSLNRVVLASLPKRSDPPATIACVTCHRGSPVPGTIETVLAATIDRSGVDSAVAQYKRLRENATAGRYDFTEGPINELAGSLADRGKTAEAIRLLQMNQEFFPNSAGIDFLLAEVYLGRGEKDNAIARYRAVLAKRPNDRRAQLRLQELGVRP